MTTITREQLIKKAQEQIAFCRDTKVTGEGRAHVDQCAALFEIALAAMDSEPVYQYQSGVYNDDNGETDWYWDDCDKGFYEQYAHDRRRILYRHAQTAPVVPEEKPMPNPLSMYAVDAVAAIAEAKGWNACRAAMLQHQPQNAQQNIPENIPGGLVEAVNNLLNNDGSRGCYDAMECGTAREKIELWLAQRQRWEEQRKANLYAGNSPVIPDGYVMVPKEPTERMVIDGFESEPDETFSEPDVWEAYQKMSGCQQAAYRARLCWAAMLASAPQEVKGE
ncbi:hypothetical protein [Klebsiella pneumoniae]|uniref:hypothetical protein n=1 Tax=Klebsiella pneumoniae TaxID=573 RepID=UPI000D65C6C6|nr:hypothetical protein [Klebsiella pneumoniae]